jgi:hypothetical protein
VGVSREGPINLFDAATTERHPGPINLFDGNPTTETTTPTVEQVTPDEDVQMPDVEEGEVLPGGTWVGRKEDSPLEFDWPSKSIKDACEAVFPKGESRLPALNWIPEDKATATRMQNIEKD